MMKQRQNVFAAVSLIAGGVALGILGCASNRPKGTHETRVEREALMTVEAIDVPHRLVTVRGASGDSLTVYVDESVKTFPQASVGDQVRVRYVESMAFQLRKAGDTIQGFEVTDESTRPKPGHPSAAASKEIKTTVKIEAVDQGGSRVTFTGPRGRRTAQIQDASMRDYASKLRPGDNVEVTYKEALALSLEKVQR